MQLADIKKLTDLARIDMSEEEMIEIAKDFDSILAYVSQVQEASKLISEKKNTSEKNSEDYFSHNVMREDEVTNKPGEYTEKIIANMPEMQDEYLKVKQIL